MNKVDLSVSLCGVTLKNPIIAASGTYGFGRDFTRFYDISRLGGISAKGVTPKERAGNPPVRIVETPSGILNAVGLQNPGIDAFLETELPWMLEQGTTVICNISGNTIEEFCDMARKLNNSSVAFIEVNVSCPNVHAGGKVFGSDPESILAVTQAVRRCTDKPIVVKLSPNVSDIAEMAVAAQEGGADAVSLINTITGMAIDVNTRRPVLGNITGGMSGPAVRPVALRMCYQAAQAVSIPVVGMGGIMTGEDVVMFLLAGCTAVQVGTANLADPMACVRIIDQLEDYMNRKGIKRVEELVGALITE
ncbi:dihydroorotate dehydrogenase [Oscillospiraceae bacterium LTW-04]|nr:dihydroorotate dehydrogenase [Oscillospiraceae bacterium MB24-C1]